MRMTGERDEKWERQQETTSGTNQGEISGRIEQETYEKGETMMVNSARWMMMIRIQISLSDEQISLYATQKCLTKFLNE